jgi:RNA polymerase Rpb8
MELTLDYNVEIFPLDVGQNVVLALASSLARDPTVSQDGTVEEDRDRDVWRPDGKGRRGFEDDYDYVMYGRVYRFDPGTEEVVYVPFKFHPSKLSDSAPSGLHTHRSAGYSCH